MMIKANGEFLDFNDDIEIESQVKLFDDIESMQGDWSYQSEMDATNHNLKVLGLPFPDTIKTIYRSVPAELIDDSGDKVYTGSIRVENISGGTIKFSFFSGNNDWFGLLSDPISALPLFKYDIDLTENNIIGTWDSTSGLVFPIIDTGTLITRAYRSVIIEDFIASMYVKDLMKDIFNAQGIKLTGDLLNDNLYNSLLVTSNGRSQDEVINRSSYVNKTTAQNSITSLTKITFQDETTYPFRDGSQGNFAASTYTADVKMRVKLDFSLHMLLVAGTSYVYTYKNGVQLNRYGINEGIFGGIADFSKSVDLVLNAGDYLEIFANVNTAVSVSVTSGTIKVTPIYIYKAFGKSSVPNWTQLEFVSNVLRPFNVLPYYNSDSKTLTLDLFNKIKEKEPIDISDDIEVTETDYSEFVSSYGRSNIFKYQEGSDEDLREYNISNFISYGSGDLTIDNDFIKQSVDVVESDFTTPITYLNGGFDCSMERINFVELEEVSDHSITSVVDASGDPQLTIASASTIFAEGDIVRIETTVDTYNGDWIVNGVGANFIVLIGNVSFDGNATGTATLMRHRFTTDDNVYLFVNVPFAQCLFFSSNYTFTFDQTPVTFASLAYFNLLSNGREINTKFKQSLSFGTVNNPLSYQQTLLQTYWPIFSAILNDPLMLRISAMFQKSKFILIKTFLRPLRVKTVQTNNLYYLNRTTGYKSGHQKCEGEIIKL